VSPQRQPAKRRIGDCPIEDIVVLKPWCGLPANAIGASDNGSRYRRWDEIALVEKKTSEAPQVVENASAVDQMCGKQIKLMSHYLKCLLVSNFLASPCSLDIRFYFDACVPDGFDEQLHEFLSALNALERRIIHDSSPGAGR
jgi:hypothetical protein